MTLRIFGWMLALCCCINLYGFVDNLTDWLFVYFSCVVFILLIVRDIECILLEKSKKEQPISELQKVPHKKMRIRKKMVPKYGEEDIEDIDYQEL